MKIVTSTYELLRHCGGHYKAFEASYMRAVKLLPKDDEIKYVIYTDIGTYNSFKNDFEPLERREDVTIKFFEWTDSEYHSKLQPIIEGCRLNVPCDQLHDKHIAVNGYCEVVLNKFNFVLENIEEDDDVVFWIDGGLFLGSCNFPWRDWIEKNCNTKFFLNKAREMAKDDFLLVQSDYMPHPTGFRTILHETVPDATGSDLVVAGGFWGGNPTKVKELCSEMKEYGHKLLETRWQISDQECMAASVMKDNSRFKIVNFGDWYDYQKTFLQIMDLYNPETYHKENCNLPNVIDE